MLAHKKFGFKRRNFCWAFDNMRPSSATVKTNLIQQLHQSIKSRSFHPNAINIVLPKKEY